MADDTGGGSTPGDPAPGGSDPGAADPASPDTGGDWKSALPAELQAAPFLRNSTTVEQALQELAGAADYMGNALRVPGPDASPERVAEFHEKLKAKVPGLVEIPEPGNKEAWDGLLTQLGKPDEAGKYTVPEVEGMPLSPERLGQLKTMAHEAGLTKSQFTDFVQKIVTKELEDANTSAANHEADIQALKGEWGNAYEQRMAMAKKAAEATNAPDDLVAAMADGKLGAATLRWLHNLADSLGTGEGSELLDQGKDGGATVMTPLEAMNQLQEVEEQLFGKNITPDRRALLTRKRMELMRSAYPDSSDDMSQYRAGL